jgi:hypothetical protein
MVLERPGTENISNLRLLVRGIAAVLNQANGLVEVVPW